MHRRVERGEAPSPAVSDQHGSLGPGTVQHRAQIVRSHVEVRRPEHAIGETGASLVEQDDAREGGQALEEPSAPRGLELDLEVPRHPERVHEIERSVASYLIGDVHAVDRLRIADLRDSTRGILNSTAVPRKRKDGVCAPRSASRDGSSWALRVSNP